MNKPFLRIPGLSLLIAISLLCTNCHSDKKENKGHLTEQEEEREREEEHGEGHQSGAEKQLSTWNWAKGYPDPTYMYDKYWKAWEQYQEIKKNTSQLLSQNLTTETYGNWTSLGSVAGIGGRIVCIAIDPNDNNNLFIGSASGGIWKSTNAGSNWSYVNTDLPALGIGAIAYHPTNSSIILAGTGEVYRADTSNIGYNIWKARGTYGIGIIRSTNGGATWSQVMVKSTSELFGIQEIKFDPSNVNTVYACATDGVYKSTDGGATWNMTPVFSGRYVRDIAIHPTNSNELVITVGNLVNPVKGIYRTTNGGANWTKAGAPIPTTFPGYIKLDNNGTRLYASVGRGGTNNELFMSTDFGATWIAKTGSDHCGGQYWFAHDVEVDPNNADRVIMGGVNYYTYTSSSTTGGAGTRAGFASGVHADVHDIEFQPGSSSVIYIACDGGMYKTTNGSTFSAINNGLIAVQFYASIAASPTANVFIGGLQDNGVVRYSGGSWTSIVGGDGGPSVFHPKNGNKVLYSNDARAVYWSDNAGGSETQLMLNLGYGYSPAAYDDRTGFMSPVAMSYPTTTPNNLVAYVGSDNLHICLDSGGTFSRATPASMTRYIDAQYKPAISMAVSRNDRNKLYVSTSPVSQRADDALNFNPPARVMRSLNASNNTSYTFSNISGSLPDRFTTDFAISRFSDDSVYITLGGFGTGHVYLTPDGGTTWLNRSNGLPDMPFNAILIDPVRPNVIYAACDFGVYVSHNKGVNWYDFSEGFWETTQVMDLQVTFNNRLVAATHGKGAFTSDLFTPPVTLPVRFTSFTGVNNGSRNDLTWNVEQEINLSRYEVERSIDGSNYQRVGTVTARNTPLPQTYNYSDNIAGTPAPVYYYRLKAINQDGTWFYSDVVAIKLTNQTGFKVLGNPFTDHVSFRYAATERGKMTIQLADMKGRVIRKEEQAVTTGIAYYTVSNLSALPPGVYVLELWIGRERYTEKLIRR